MAKLTDEQRKKLCERMKRCAVSLPPHEAEVLLNHLDFYLTDDIKDFKKYNESLVRHIDRNERIVNEQKREEEPKVKTELDLIGEFVDNLPDMDPIIVNMDDLITYLKENQPDPKELSTPKIIKKEQEQVPDYPHWKVIDLIIKTRISYKKLNKSMRLLVMDMALNLKEEMGIGGGTYAFENYYHSLYGWITGQKKNLPTKYHTLTPTLILEQITPEDLQDIIPK
jgi:hypothetical protein